MCALEARGGPQRRAERAGARAPAPAHSGHQLPRDVLLRTLWAIYAGKAQPARRWSRAGPGSGVGGGRGAGPVSRGVRLMAHDRARSAQGLAEYCTLIDSSSSFRAYRAALSEVEPPCIPYM